MCGIALLLINALIYPINESDLSFLHTQTNAHYKWDKYWTSSHAIRLVRLIGILNWWLSTCSRSGCGIILLEPGRFLVKEPQIYSPEEKIQKSKYLQIITKEIIIFFLFLAAFVLLYDWYVESSKISSKQRSAIRIFHANLHILYPGIWIRDIFHSRDSRSPCSTSWQPEDSNHHCYKKILENKINNFDWKFLSSSLQEIYHKWKSFVCLIVATKETVKPQRSKRVKHSQDSSSNKKLCIRWVITKVREGIAVATCLFFYNYVVKPEEEKNTC